MMIGEDFLYYFKVWFGVFFLIGCGNKDKGIIVFYYNFYFDIDEFLLKYVVSEFLKILEIENVF